MVITSSSDNLVLEDGDGRAAPHYGALALLSSVTKFHSTAERPHLMNGPLIIPRNVITTTCCLCERGGGVLETKNHHHMQRKEYSRGLGDTEGKEEWKQL